MIKHFCDCCGEEMSRGNDFVWLCHLTDIANGHNCCGYVDINGNSVSGRTDGAELCNKCYNEVVVKSVKKYFELKEKYSEQC
ncbi:MAG: hypothetical protein ACOC22_04650 [bacterium]